MANNLTAGDKIAKPVAMRLIKSSKKGTLGMEVAFDFEEQSTGNRERLFWTAWLTKDAIENSMKTLVEVLGYNGSEVTDKEGVFTDPNVLNFNQEVKLVTEFETRRDELGVAKVDKEGNELRDLRIKWVNKLGGGGFAGVKPEVVKSELAGIGFRAAFLAAKNKTPGLPSSDSPSPQDPPEPSFNPDEIPF